MFPEGRQRYQELRNNGVSKNQDDEKFESTSIDDLNALDKPQSARRIIGSHIDLMNERSKSFNLGTSKRMPDSHDYEPDESDVWRSFKEQRFKSDKGKWWTTMRRVSLLRWLITFAIGVCTGLTAILVSLGTDVFTRLKFDMTNNIMDKSGGPSFFVFLIFCSFNMIYVAMANLMVYIEPLSAGSGIPDIKCFLNGTSVLGVVRLRVFFCKVIGVMFSVAGGLPAGKEGPMVHSGSVIASAISQGGDISCAARGSFQDFRNDREKRDFVASGAAAGVAGTYIHEHFGYSEFISSEFSL